MQTTETVTETRTVAAPKNAHKIEMVAFHITKACSHHCPFCYYTSSGNAPEPDYSKIVDIVRALAENQVAEVSFVGGDPCEYNRLLDVAALAKSLGMKTTVLSNTHSYPESDTRTIATAIDNFETTFHGPSAIYHDAIANKSGAFDLVISNLRRLADNARSMGIAYNITPLNFNAVFQTVKVLIETYKLPIDHLVVQRIVPFGRGASASQFTISIDHARIALKQIDLAAKKYRLYAYFEDPLPLCLISKQYHQYMSRCQWGITRAAVDYNGNVSRCGADPRYRLGNLLERSLLDIWNSSEVLDRFRKLEYLPESCKNCEMRERCGGGCALSCEIKEDHAPDYLVYGKHSTTAKSFQSQLQLQVARSEDLSEILRIEWSCFPEFRHKFIPSSITRWYSFNPQMFLKWAPETGTPIYGYCCLVPLKQSGYRKITQGVAASLSELEPSDVCSRDETPGRIWHLEAIAAVRDRPHNAGRRLVEAMMFSLLGRADIITATAITQIGEKLCRYFGFSPIAIEKSDDTSYCIYRLIIDKQKMTELLERYVHD